MRIVVLSPTPPYRSGLSYYVLYLYRSFPKIHTINIITNKDSMAEGNENLIVSKIFTPGRCAPWLCLREIVLRNPDILHIHVEYAFLGSWLNFLLLPLLLLILRVAVKSKIVITLHGIPNYYSISYYLKKVLRIPIVIRAFLNLAYTMISYTSVCLSCMLSHSVIVHADLMKSALACFIPRKILSKIHVIAHGVYEPPDNLRRLKSDKKNIIVLTLGYQRPTKGIETLIKAAEEIGRERRNVKFMAIGKRINRLFEKVAIYYSKPMIEIIDTFLEDKMLDNVIRMADIIVLPYEDLFYEVSGTLHRVALFGKPLICSDIPRFRSCLIKEKDALFFTVGNHFELSKCILRLLEDNLLARQLSKNLFEKFSYRKWTLIAKEHEQLFLKLINTHSSPK